MRFAPALMTASASSLDRTPPEALTPNADPTAPPENWGMLILGSGVAAVVSFLAVKWLLRYVQTHTFSAFGWYRIALGVLIFVLIR